MELNSQKFLNVYADMGINLHTLGCVMAPIELIPEPDSVKDILYKTTNPERFWIDGWVASKKAHVTILYGLLFHQLNITDQNIRDVLGGWGLPFVEVDHVGFFNSPYKDEEYFCVVAHLRTTDKLLEGHQRLSLLPHINTFPEYKPHMTLGYIKCDYRKLNEVIDEMDDFLKFKTLEVTGDIKISRK